MMHRAAKLRLRRHVRRSQKHVETIGSQAEKGLDRHFFRRLERFVDVRRFVFGWVLLFLLLSGGVVMQNRALSRFYQTLEPGKGGIYTEGIVGSFTNANPLYATSSVDASVSRLVFSGLMKYDDRNRIVPDLAESIKADSTGSVYTAKLRKNVFWHDGKPFTAKDVVFTYQVIQKADARSPLIKNWSKVEIKALNSHTVQFTLPNTIASFPGSLVTGIIPEHILGKVPAGDLRSASFNTARPIGTGPFKWDAVQVIGSDPVTREEQIGLISNDGYYNTRANLERFIIRAFHDQQSLTDSFAKGELSAAAGLSSVPEKIKNKKAFNEFSVPLMGEVMVFLNNSNAILKDSNVRRALVMATDQNEIVRNLDYPVIYANSPLLPTQIGYREDTVQYGFNQKQAGKILDASGWKKDKSGVRYKKNKQLTFKLYSQSESQYTNIVQTIQKQWSKIGVNIEVVLEPEDKIQTTIASHQYDALLYGITIGTDPDVYAYWHSSQADPRSSSRLNLSEYKSKTADAALEAGRSRLDEKQRALKYKPFLKAWRKDAPAIGLYQPRYLYITKGKLFGFEPTRLNSSVDRYANVENWAVRQDKVDIY